MDRTWIRIAVGLGALALIACNQGNAQPNAAHLSAVSPAGVEHLKAAVAPLVDRSPATRQEVQIGNRTEIRFLSGNRQVMVARRNTDGTVTTACVDSVEGAQQALTQPVSNAAPTRREVR